ncbi:CBS domain-containing protein [Reichenbachiella ulvae]|uniref:CBS domain-containing protein n=1 Tax=Reichenbachiella ulvae TaxID=2980104 RepID=A0ABT3CTP2_9BACT|nr:CBS domain-containing protein [Reichenbachiella ulvae]MCV9386956.1 CBS domain-containing protein [Reichenbachiella ulvae]
MSKDLITVDLTDPIQEVMNVFEQIRIKHVPVMANGTLVGIISQSDVSRLSFGSKLMDDQTETDTSILEMISVNQVMKPNPVTIGVTHSIKEAAEIFTRSTFHALPVTENNELVGIVTTTDLIKYMLKLSE